MLIKLVHKLYSLVVKTLWKFKKLILDFSDLSFLKNVHLPALIQSLKLSSVKYL